MLDASRCFQGRFGCCKEAPSRLGPPGRSTVSPVSGRSTESWGQRHSCGRPLGQATGLTPRVATQGRRKPWGDKFETTARSRPRSKIPRSSSMRIPSLPSPRGAVQYAVHMYQPVKMISAAATIRAAREKHLFRAPVRMSRGAFAAMAQRDPVWMGLDRQTPTFWPSWLKKDWQAPTARRLDMMFPSWAPFTKAPWRQVASIRQGIAPEGSERRVRPVGAQGGG
ncbi:hypothetical protein QBC34DRAFT_10242 [Podospora aff. communis PSN243]|uniref:Uncharacterized protein n=1 Tax=Podospora aff. communis PSN243 TaxID=3040156 RepID=A0AAV9HAL7_9PEZI|nr:hypothetical protein QBC34DRAFT_10242 [Podospora aff. communis PSN243]